MRTQISIFLFIYGVVLSLLYIRGLNPSPSILIKGHILSRENSINLLLGTKISQEISSRYNNLGTIAVRFQTFDRINDDTLVFRVKEDIATDWYYTADYKTDQFQDRELFPFGFPIIKDSKNKIYSFELESKQGSESSHVKIDDLRPSVVSKYKYQIYNSDIGVSGILKYFLLKTQNILTNTPTPYTILLYFLPFLVYIASIIIHRDRKQLSFRVLLFPVAYILLRPSLSIAEPQYMNLTIILIWNLSLIFIIPASKINLKISMLLLMCVIYYLIENNIPQVEIVMYWLIIATLLGYIYDIILPRFFSRKINLKSK